MIQLVTASTMFQVASLAAMVDAGALPSVDGPRVLVLANGTQQPELTTPIQEMDGFATLASKFDRVVDFAQLVWPRRPSQFKPREEELYLWERLLRSHWGLADEPVQLVVESIQVDPNLSLCRIFHDAPIIVHSDGLMSYGPTRTDLPRQVWQRLDAVLHVDLVPGLRPLLLREFDPRLVPVAPSALAASFSALAESSSIATPDWKRGGKTALLLGQYLSQLGLLSDDEEASLHRDMLLEAKRRGAERIVFKPHPSAGSDAARRLALDAADIGLEFHLLADPVLAETAVALLRPDVVVSCFSTALVTIRYVFGTECAAVGTEMMLERLSPYQNSNRIPTTLIDALLVRGIPAPSHDDAPHARLQQLVNAVAYCMQPKNLEDLRDAAASFLEHHGEQYRRYFKKRRLTALELPGATPAASWRRRAGHVRRRARRLLKNVPARIKVTSIVKERRRG